MRLKEIELVLLDRREVHKIRNVEDIDYNDHFVCFTEVVGPERVAHYFNVNQVLCFDERMQK